MNEADRSLLLPEATHQRRIEVFATEMHQYLSEEQSWGNCLMDYDRIKQIDKIYKNALKRAGDDLELRSSAHMNFISALFTPDIIFLSYPQAGGPDEYSFIAPNANDENAWDKSMGKYGWQYYQCLPELRGRVKKFYKDLNGDLNIDPHFSITAWLRTWKPEIVPQEANFKSHEGALSLAKEEEVKPDDARLKYAILYFFGLLVGASVTLLTYDQLGLSKTAEHQHADGHVSYAHSPTQEGWMYIAGGSVAISLAVMLLYNVMDRVSKACSNLGGCTMGMCWSRESKVARQEREFNNLNI